MGKFSGDYNEEYYKNGRDDYLNADYWRPFFGSIADELINRFHPKKVLDAGCALGYLVEAFRDRGVDAYGIDISEYAIKNVRCDIKPYCYVGSLANDFPEELQQKYDLITNIEVLEHLSECDGIKAINNMCRYSDCILFSSSPDDFDEPSHINVQPREYWVKKFYDCSFYDDLSYRPNIISPQAIQFRKIAINSVEELIDNYEQGIVELCKKTDKYYCDLIAEKKNNEELVLNNKKIKELIDDLYNSTSWKITQPMRKIKNSINKHI